MKIEPIYLVACVEFLYSGFFVHLSSRVTSDLYDDYNRTVFYYVLADKNNNFLYQSENFNSVSSALNSLDEAVSKILGVAI